MKTEHQRWWKRLQRTLRDMPTDMEILVGAHGDITAARRGASKREFDRSGDVDNVETIDLPAILSKGVENNGSSL